MTAEIALNALYSHFQGELPPENISVEINAPLFVTWEKNGNLRGCIGTFKPQSANGVSKYALIAALNDTRFPPITMGEFQKLSCTVTLLEDFVDISESPYNWEIGVHGIELELPDLGLSATFLPSVAEEQGWTQEETFDNLIRKAGTRGHLKDYLNYKITRYTGVKSTMDAKHYLSTL